MPDTYTGSEREKQDRARYFAQREAAPMALEISETEGEILVSALLEKYHDPSYPADARWHFYRLLQSLYERCPNLRPVCYDGD